MENQKGENFLGFFLLWAIRKDQNAAIFQGVRSNPTNCVQSAVAFWNSYTDTMRRQGFQMNEFTSANDTMVWSPPQQDYLKFNVDGGFKEGKGAAAVILLDPEGRFLYGSSKKISLL